MTKLKKAITKAEAYDLLSGTIARAFVKGFTQGKMLGSEFEKGQFAVLKNLLGIVKEIDESVIKEEVKA